MLKPYNKSHLATTLHTVSIPPNSEVILPVKVRKVSQAGQTLFFEPISTLPTKYNVLGAKSIAQVHHSKSMFRVFNFTNSTVHLPANTPVALGEQSIETIYEDTDCHENVYTVTHNTNTDALSTTQDSDKYIEQARKLGFDLQESDLTDSQKKQLLILLGQNTDVFATNPTELGTYEDYEHYIDIGTAQPMRQKYYRTSPKIRQEINKQITEFQQNGVLEQADDNAWLSPVVLVRKKDNTYRFACDFRALNRVTTPMKFPQTQFQSVVDEMGS